MRSAPDDPVRRLFDLIATLRAPGGCPWDREQTFEDVISDLVEEAYELQWAGTHHGPAEILDETGDVLFLVCFAISIRNEQDPDFDLAAVARHAYDKIYSRHPHVFGDESAATAADSIAHWEKMKAAERERRNADASALDGVAGNLPPLRHAEKVQERAASVGFDWDDTRDIFAKVREEVDELEEAVSAGDRSEIQHEIGDLLFSIVNVARFLELEPEGALNGSTSKFIRRFRAMEKMIADDGKRLPDLTLAQMDEYWDRVKSQT
jgi:tetrapyrrole methylase family protein/MazG family protein